MKPVVRIAQGALIGAERDGLSVFRAIPYAASPRFAPPGDPPRWTGERDATQPGPVAPQLPSRLGPLFGDGTGRPAMSEQCQTVSVFTPDVHGKRPVLVWFHGGANVSGGGELPVYDPSRLAAEGGIVCVAVGYRLGVFGYLHHADPSLRNGEWQRSYYGNNYSRLQRIKRDLDPGNFLQYEQSIRPA